MAKAASGTPSAGRETWAGKTRWRKTLAVAVEGGLLVAHFELNRWLEAMRIVLEPGSKKEEACEMIAGSGC